MASEFSRQQSRWVESLPVTEGRSHTLGTSSWKLPEPVLDGMTYQSSFLLSWRVFYVPGVRTALGKSATWWMMLWLFGVSLMIAMLVVVIVPNPAMLKSGKFQEVGNFLKTFVSLMLAFFLTTAVSRWRTCIYGFLEVFDSIRNIHMQLHALGVPAERRTHIARYGVISAYLLYMELKIGEMKDEQKAMDETSKMWEDLKNGSLATSKQRMKYLTLLPDEEKLLLEVQHPEAVIWVWVASLVASLAQRGEIPPMASPTYSRIMTHAERAHEGVRKVKGSIQVRAPFIYMQILASIVHINNFVNAVAFGITMGSLTGTLLMYVPLLVQFVRYKEQSRREDVTMDVENFVVAIFVNMFGILIYQTLLDVCICIAEPFNTKESNIPVMRFLTNVIKDLIDRDTLAINPPSWEAPCFKPNH